MRTIKKRDHHIVLLAPRQGVPPPRGAVLDAVREGAKKLGKPLSASFPKRSPAEARAIAGEMV